MRIPPNERLLGILGYLPLLFLIPLKFKRDSVFVQFHARQSGVLFGLWLAASLVVTILLFPFSVTPYVSPALFLILFLVQALYALMMLAGMIKVALGERYRMPVVADVALMLRL